MSLSIRFLMRVILITLLSSAVVVGLAAGCGSEPRVNPGAGGEDIDNDVQDDGEDENGNGGPDEGGGGTNNGDGGSNGGDGGGNNGGGGTNNGDGGSNNGDGGANCGVEEVIPEPGAAQQDPCRPDGGWGTVAVFVATHGDDSGAGDIGAPKATIKAGLETAKEEGKKLLLVQAGTYEETVELVDGVQIIGAYDVGWRYRQSNRAIVRGGNPTLRGEDITSLTRLINLRFDPVQTVGYGESVVTAYLQNSGGVVLQNVHINGGRAGDGDVGFDGVVGAPGKAGGDGKLAKRTDPFPFCNYDIPGAVGRGATSICLGTGGGDGGPGGRAGDKGPLSGPGKAAEGGAAGGSRSGDERNAGKGSDGASGQDGAHGSGGENAGYFDGLMWVGTAGQDGKDGTHGKGGGGGGGAGGKTTTATCNFWGGSGGGGGSGGCGASGGTGGQPGGATIGLFLEESDIEIIQSRIVGGIGGDGGRGGLGQAGGRGGKGGKGGDGKGEGGNGGDGGDGGKGGDGGNGGGGAGGPSFAIFSTSEVTKVSEDSRIEAGVGGKGGGPTGVPTEGADGVTADIQVGLDY